MALPQVPFLMALFPVPETPGLYFTNYYYDNLIRLWLAARRSARQRGCSFSSEQDVDEAHQGRVACVRSFPELLKHRKWGITEVSESCPKPISELLRSTSPCWYPFPPNLCILAPKPQALTCMERAHRKQL